MPVAQPQTVFVVDDNPDLVHFYRRYTTNTRYRIVSLEDDDDILGQIARVKPDIIVLDVMLPDLDGWELLTLLKRSDAARSIPVIVCSVTQGGELAASLGAALYVQKPVGRREFIDALDLVSGRH